MEGLLVAIWSTALALCVGAIAWMSSLIVARLFRQRADRRREVSRSEVTSALVGILRGDAEATTRLQPYLHRARLMAEALLEVLALVRGADRERLVATLRDLGLARTLAVRLDRGSTAGRLASMEALAALGGDEAKAALRRVVEHGAPSLRVLALKSLVEAGAPISIGRLLDHLVLGEIPPSRLFSDLLRRAAAERPAEAMAALDRPNLPRHAEAMLLEALGAAGDYQAVPKLIEAGRDASPDVRAAALRGLGRLMHPAAEQAVTHALRDPVWFVRAAAAETAGAAGFVRLADGLSALLTDEVWWVRFRAAEALASLGQEGIARLEQLSRGGAGVAQVAAALALAERKAG